MLTLLVWLLFAGVAWATNVPTCDQTPNCLCTLDDDAGINYDATENQLFINRTVDPGIYGDEAGLIVNRGIWIIADENDANQRIISYGGTPQVIYYRTQGTEASPTALNVNNQLVHLRALGWDGDSWVASHELIEADEDWTGSSSPTRWRLLLIPSGSQTELETLRVTRNTFTYSSGATGNATVVLPNDSIGDAEVDFATVTCADMTMSDCGAITASDLTCTDCISAAEISALGTLTDGNFCQAGAGSTLDCDVLWDNDGDCTASAVCLGGHGHTQYLTAEVDGSTTNELQNIFQTMDTSSGVDPVADTTTDTLQMTGTAPITVTGSEGPPDSVTIALTQNAGTDVTADLEEETHAGEHSLGGGDAVTVTNLASACTNAQVLGGTVAGTGVECQADAGLTTVGDTDISAGAVDGGSAGEIQDSTISRDDIDEALLSVETHATDCTALTCDAASNGEVCFEQDADLMFVCDGSGTPAWKKQSTLNDGVTTYDTKVWIGGAWVNRTFNTGDLPVSGSEIYIANTFSEFGTYVDPTEVNALAFSGDMSIPANQCWFSTTGLACEGATDAYEGLLSWSPTTQDQTITIPNLGDSADTMCVLDHAQTLTNKTLTTPTIASFANATHNHSNAAGGGDVALASGSTAATAASGDSDTSVATTAFVQQEEKRGLNYFATSNVAYTVTDVCVGWYQVCTCTTSSVPFNCQIIVPKACTLNSLYAEVDTAVLTGSWVVTVYDMDQGSDTTSSTGLTCTISSGRSCQDTTHTHALTAGQKIGVLFDSTSVTSTKPSFSVSCD